MSNTTLNNLPSDLEAAHQLITQLFDERDQLHQHRQQLHNDLKKERQAKEQVEAEKAQIIAQAQEAKVLFEEEKALLLHRLHLLLRHQYGRRSERFIDPNQLALFDQVFESVVPKAPQMPQEAPSSKSKKPRRGRQPLPAHLPRLRVEHELKAKERTCPCCGQERQVMGEQLSEQLEHIPEMFYVIEHVRFQYACKGCQSQVTISPPAPKPIEKGIPGPGLLADVVINKYYDHLPLYRQEDMFKRSGVQMARSTLCDWMAAASDLLAPLVSLMHQQVLQSKRIHTDDTPVPVQDKGRGKTRQGRLWVYVGDPSQPFTVYDYTPGRSREGPIAFLKHFQKGYLQADAYPGYEEIYNDPDRKVIEVGCWAHARRMFEQALKTDGKRATFVMDQIRKLYKVEKHTKSLNGMVRQQQRQKQSKPILEALKPWLEDQRQQVLPKSPMGQAIGYTLNQWKALNRYLEDGDLQIDNNIAERAMRRVVIGRKNWLFAGSDRGGRTAAILYSVMETCRRLEINPHRYLRDLFLRLPSTPPAKLHELLPNQWVDPIQEAVIMPPVQLLKQIKI